jgi:hypothetical protein
MGADPRWMCLKGGCVMHLRKWTCLVVCLTFIGCGTQKNRCPSGHHEQVTLCMPN